MIEKPRRAPSPTGSEQTGDETLAEGGRGRAVTVDKPRPDGKVELTEQAAYEKLGFCYSTTRKYALSAGLLRSPRADLCTYRRWSILSVIFLVQVCLHRLPAQAAAVADLPLLIFQQCSMNMNTSLYAWVPLQCLSCSLCG